MATYDIRPLQLRILRTLLTVDRVCRTHGLRYYIMAGTMLGAVRHKGFIPWDDDLDIGMPRPDYDLLMTHAREWLPYPYEAVSGDTDEDFSLPFAKIQDADTTLIEKTYRYYLGGVYIDVFPLDGMPDGRWSRRWLFLRYAIYTKLLYFIHRDPFKHGHGPRSWVPWLCHKLLSSAGMHRRIRRVMTSYDFDRCAFVGDFDDGMRGIMSKDVLGKPTPVTFEGNTVLGVQNPHAYLTRKYGDYMTIPKGHQQRQHNFHYLDLSLPYRQYKG